jgi:hypothetical protein
MLVVQRLGPGQAQRLAQEQAQKLKDLLEVKAKQQIL